MIGEKCLINKSKIEKSLIMDNCHIGEDTLIENCCIGKDVRIDKGMKLYNCFIGDNFHVIKNG